MHYGEVMARGRARAKMTQEEMAARLGVSQRTISAWECGDREPNVTAYLRYMAACKGSARSLQRIDPLRTGSMSPPPPLARLLTAA